jgi:ATP-dependent helicase HepA
VKPTHKLPAIGTFVCASTGPFACLGPGKLAGVEGSSAHIQYFDAPGAPLPPKVAVHLALIARARLPAQTRVYRRMAGGRWQTGRVLEDDADVVFVQFPNDDTVNIAAEELQVRWNRPLKNPLSLLASEATETPFLADARAKFVHAAARQHHAAAGVSAILCSSIELVPYQFAVIQRVLSDPIQRYLLADEVGLGKTIEAAVIIRQYFIDDPAAQVALMVPPALVHQWRKELTLRFGLGNELDETLHVVAHDDLKTLRRVIATAGMLVVDEAHHLSRQTTADQREFYELIREHARHAPRLILLSATPVLGNAEEFLRVLHLLDPVVFPLEDLDGFRLRISSRQVVAEVISTLVPENVWGLGPDLERLLDNYSDDPLLVAKVEALKTVLSTFPSDEDPVFLSAMEDLKTHLVESYRLHRRLLRNRRSAFSWATPQRSEMRLLPFTGEATNSWLEKLERLRLALATYGNLPIEVDQALLQTAVHPHGTASLRDLLGNSNVDNQDILSDAAAVDRAIDRVRKDPSRIVALRRHIRTVLEVAGAQVVVFCDLPAVADDVTQALSDELGSQVSRHEPAVIDADTEQSSLPWERFLSSPDQVRVLVCDARAEEGVNLHGGRKIALHFDLPASPNRLEQRLGRLDRFGTGHPILSYALVDEANPNEVAWAQVLDSGWEVFRQSVASLQYLIESTAAPLARDWMEQGTEALRLHKDNLGGADGMVKREVRQLNHQDQIDGMDQTEVPGFNTLEDADEDWADWRAAFKALAIDVLRFQWRSEEDSAPSKTAADPAFRIGYSYGNGGGGTLLPLTGFLKHFLGTVDQNAAGGGARNPLTYRYAFKRQSTTNSLGLAKATRLLRIGDPFVTSLENFAATDDRGRAFGVWRVDRQYEPNDPSGADLYFRFDFMVRPATDFTQDGLDDLSAEERVYAQTLLRKASTLLPPLSLRTWVAGNGSIEDSPSERLTCHYANGWVGTRRDFNLNPERWRALPPAVKSTWLRDWVQLCEKLRDIAVQTIEGDPVYVEHVKSALEACIQEKRLRRTQGEARASRLEGQAHAQEMAELRQAEAMYSALEAAIAHPRLDLEVVGAVFLASEEPFQE